MSSLCFQLVFSFSDKLFSLLIKDIEAMDPSILKGERSSGKKPKVPGEQSGIFSSRMSCNKCDTVTFYFRYINANNWLCFSSQLEIGLLLANSQVVFEKSETSSMTLVGECCLILLLLVCVNLQLLKMVTAMLESPQTRFCHHWLRFDVIPLEGRFLPVLSGLHCQWHNDNCVCVCVLQVNLRPENLSSPSSTQTGTLKRWVLEASTKSFLTSSAEPLPPESSHQI